jgi:hypothetical protein
VRFLSYVASVGAAVVVILSSSATPNNQKHIFSPVSYRTEHVADLTQQCLNYSDYVEHGAQ